MSNNDTKNIEYISEEQDKHTQKDVNDIYNRVNSVFDEVDLPIDDKTGISLLDYPDRYIGDERFVRQGYIRIGDSIFRCPPTAISVRVTNDVHAIPLVRSSTMQLFSTGKCEKVVSIELYFNGRSEIYGIERSVPYYEDGVIRYRNVPHPNTLRALVAQFKRMPFVPVESHELIKYGIDALALLQLDIETVPNYPNLLKATITATQYEYRHVLPGMYRLQDWIIWPVWRWHWRNEYIDTAATDNSADVSNRIDAPPEDDKPFNEIKFYVLDKSELEKRKIARQKIDLSLGEAYKWTESELIKHAYAWDMDYENIHVISMHISFTNQFSALQLLDSEHSALQFMGGNNCVVQFNGYCRDYTIDKFEAMFGRIRELVRSYHFEINSGFFFIENELLNKLNVHNFIPSRYEFTTVQNQPSLRAFTIQAMEFDTQQSAYEQFKRIRTILTQEKLQRLRIDDTNSTLSEINRAIHAAITEKALSNSSVVAFASITGRLEVLKGVNVYRILDYRKSGMFKNAGYKQSAMEAMKSMELYPDLSLPTVEDLVHSIIGISADFVRHGGKPLVIYEISKQEQDRVSAVAGQIMEIASNMITTNIPDAAQTLDLYNSQLRYRIDINSIKPGLIDIAMFYTGGLYVDPDFYMYKLNYNPFVESLLGQAELSADEYIVERTRQQYIGKYRLPRSADIDEAVGAFALNTTMIENMHHVIMAGDKQGLTPIDVYTDLMTDSTAVAAAISEFYTGKLFGPNNDPTEYIEKVDSNDIPGIEIYRDNEYKKEHVDMLWKLLRESIGQHIQDSPMYYLQKLESKQTNIMTPPVIYAAVYAKFGFESLNINEADDVFEFVELFSKELNMAEAFRGDDTVQLDIWQRIRIWVADTLNYAERYMKWQLDTIDLFTNIIYAYMLASFKHNKTRFSFPREPIGTVGVPVELSPTTGAAENIVWPNLESLQPGIMEELIKFTQALVVYIDIYSYEMTYHAKITNETAIAINETIASGASVSETDINYTNLVRAIGRTMHLKEGIDLIRVINGLNAAEHSGYNDYKSVLISSPMLELNFNNLVSNNKEDYNSYWAFGPLQLLLYDIGEPVFDNVSDEKFQEYRKQYKKLMLPSKTAYVSHGTVPTDVETMIVTQLNYKRDFIRKFMNYMLSNLHVYYEACLWLLRSKLKDIDAGLVDENYLRAICTAWYSKSDDNYYRCFMLGYEQEVPEIRNNPEHYNALLQAMGNVFNVNATTYQSADAGAKQMSSIFDQYREEKYKTIGVETNTAGLGFMQFVRYGAPFDHTTQFEHFWGHYIDLFENTFFGRIITAFPSYCLLIIDEAESGFIAYNPIYNSSAALISCSIRRDWKDPVDVCTLELSNCYRHLSSYLADQYLANMQYRHNWFSAIGLLMPGVLDRAFGFYIKERNYRYILNQREKDIQALILRPGVRIHLRLGYSANAMNMPIAFNGTVTEVAPAGDTLSIIAQGDGVELVKKIPATNMAADIRTFNFGWEPRELIVHMMMSRGDMFNRGITQYWWEILRRFLEGSLAGRIFARNPLGIKHFGDPLYFDLQDVDFSTLNTYDKIFIEINKIISDVTNIYTGGKIESKFLGGIPSFAIACTLPLVAGVGIYYIGLPILSAVAAAPIIGIPLAAATVGGIFAATYYISKYFKLTARKACGEIGENVYSITGYEEDENGEIPLGRLNSDLGFLHSKKVGMNMYIFNKSPWDLMRLMADANPNFVVAVRPFEFRSTLFFGQPYYQYRYSYSRVGIDECLANDKFIKYYGIPMCYLMKTFSQIHLAHSSLNMFGNNITASEDEMCNQIIATYYTQPGLSQSNMAAETQVVSRWIYPERRKTNIVDTNYVGFTMDDSLQMRYFALPFKNWILKPFYNMHTRYYTTREKARMIARSILRDYVRQMYQGYVTVIGNGTIWPHDKMYINDNYNDMRGMSIVQQVNIHFSKETGFVNNVRVGPYAYVKGDKKLLELTAHGRLMGMTAVLVTQAFVMRYLMSKGYRELISAILNLSGYLTNIGCTTPILATAEIIGMTDKLIHTLIYRPNEIINDIGGAFANIYESAIEDVAALGLKETEMMLTFETSTFGHGAYRSFIKQMRALTEAGSADDVAHIIAELTKIRTEIEEATKAAPAIEKMFAERAIKLSSADIIAKALAEADEKVLQTVLKLAITEADEALSKATVVKAAETMLLTRGTLGKIILRSLLSPFSTAGSALGTVLLGPVGGTVGWFIGFALDVVLYDMLLSIPLTYFNRYFDDEYALELSVLTYRGREFTAGLNGHHLNEITGRSITGRVNGPYNYFKGYDLLLKSLGNEANRVTQIEEYSELFDSNGYTYGSLTTVSTDMGAQLAAAALNYMNDSYYSSGKTPYSPGTRDMCAYLIRDIAHIAGWELAVANKPADNWDPTYNYGPGYANSLTGCGPFYKVTEDNKASVINSIQPGDILFFARYINTGITSVPDGYYIAHVGLAINNTQMIHYSSSAGYLPKVVDIKAYCDYSDLYGVCRPVAMNNKPIMKRR